MKIRYLMVNTPETTGGKNECYGQNAVTFNTDLVLGKTVEIDYDVECTDRFDRTLAYVSRRWRRRSTRCSSSAATRACSTSRRTATIALAEFKALETAAQARRAGSVGRVRPDPV